MRLPHRIVMGAMHLGMEGRPDAGEVLAAFYTERVRGGAGLIVTGGAAVSRAGAGGPAYGLVNEASHHPALRTVSAAVHDAGGRIALQLFHAGRYAFPSSFGLTPVAPSAVYSRFSRCEPVALTGDGVLATIDDFARGAAAARELGFDAVEVMGSEGYLVDQFLSPLTNRRDDAWGGDAERRRRFGVEVLRAVRAAVGPDFPVIIRFSGADLMDGGVPEDEVLAFARALAAGAADALNVGVGWHESPVPTVQGVVPSGVWVPVAAAVKSASGDVPVIASNRVNRLDTAESVLAAGEVDFVSMARPFLADPGLIAKGRRGARVNICIACNQACIDRSLSDEPVSCMVNPRAGHEYERTDDVPPTALRMAVVGGGPAGLQAALRLAQQGHRVELFEASDALGGQFRLACRVPGKEDYAETVRYFASELAQLGVVVHLNRAIGSGDVELLRGFDGVVVASGVHPRSVPIEGSDLPHVMSYADAFTASLPSRLVVVGGGGIAVDFAHMATHPDSRLDAAVRFRREHGLVDGAVPPSPREVTIMQRSTRTAPGIGKTTRWVALGSLRQQGVQIERGVTYRRIDADGVHILDAEGTERVVPAAAVVVAAGQEPDQVVPAVVRRAGVPYRLVGGARAVAELDAVRAFAEGLAAADELGAGVPC